MASSRALTTAPSSRWGSAATGSSPGSATTTPPAGTTPGSRCRPSARPSSTKGSAGSARSFPGAAPTTSPRRGAGAEPWLLGVARNLIGKHYAEAGQQQATVAVLAALAASESAEGDVAVVVVERAAMLRALATLPAHDQEVLTLVAWHGLTAHEAATVVGCCQGGVLRSPASSPARFDRRRGDGRRRPCTARGRSWSWATGAYWYQEERISEVHTFGTGGMSGRGPAYTVEVSQVTKSWSGRSRTRAVTTFDRPRFLTNQDRVNWRTAGSPHLMPGAPPAGNPHPNPSVNDANGPPSFIVGGEGLTIDQLKRLPTNPGRSPPGCGSRSRSYWTTGQESPSTMRQMSRRWCSGRRRPAHHAGQPGRPGGRFEVMANSDGGRLPAGATILSTTWLEAGWADKLGRRP